MNDDTILTLEEASRLSSLYILQQAEELRAFVRAYNKTHHEEAPYPQ